MWIRFLAFSLLFGSSGQGALSKSSAQLEDVLNHLEGTVETPKCRFEYDRGSMFPVLRFGEKVLLRPEESQKAEVRTLSFQLGPRYDFKEFQIIFRNHSSGRLEYRIPLTGLKMNAVFSSQLNRWNPIERIHGRYWDLQHRFDIFTQEGKKFEADLYCSPNAEMTAEEKMFSQLTRRGGDLSFYDSWSQARPLWLFEAWAENYTVEGLNIGSRGLKIARLLSTSFGGAQATVGAYLSSESLGVSRLNGAEFGSLWTRASPLFLSTVLSREPRFTMVSQFLRGEWKVSSVEPSWFVRLIRVLYQNWVFEGSIDKVLIEHFQFDQKQISHFLDSCEPCREFGHEYLDSEFDLQDWTYRELSALERSLKAQKVKLVEAETANRVRVYRSENWGNWVNSEGLWIDPSKRDLD